MVRLVVLLVAASTVAHADTGWHAGLDLRVDNGTHPIRLGGGVERGWLDTHVIVDPMFWTDGQHDVDAFATLQVSDGDWGVIAGWRTTAVDLLGGHQYQQKLLTGISAPLPTLGTLPLRWRWAFELATVVVKHGADLPTQWISFAEGRDFIDLVNFGMFVTVEYDAK